MLSAIACKHPELRALPGLPTYPAQAVSIRPKKVSILRKRFIGALGILGNLGASF
jgi:hypothetical protein